MRSWRRRVFAHAYTSLDLTPPTARTQEGKAFGVIGNPVITILRGWRCPRKCLQTARPLGRRCLAAAGTADGEHGFHLASNHKPWIITTFTSFHQSCSVIFRTVGAHRCKSATQDATRLVRNVRSCSFGPPRASERARTVLVHRKGKKLQHATSVN